MQCSLDQKNRNKKGRWGRKKPQRRKFKKKGRPCNTNQIMAAQLIWANCCGRKMSNTPSCVNFCKHLNTHTNTQHQPNQEHKYMLILFYVTVLKIKAKVKISVLSKLPYFPEGEETSVSQRERGDVLTVIKIKISSMIIFQSS